MKVHTLRVLLAGVLALMAALVIIYAMLSLRAYFAGGRPGAGSGGSTMTDEQKLQVLQSLKSTSTPSVTQSKKVLNALSGSSSAAIREEAKLDILKSLHSK